MISPEIQEDAIGSYAARNGMRVVATIPDIDKSGRSFTKRRVHEVIEGIQEGRWTHVLLWKWSRWGRNLQQSLVYLEAVKRAGGVVHAATEDFDERTSVGRFTRDQMLLIAEFQSNQIADGWRETHNMRRKAGLPSGGGARWGYFYPAPDGSKRYVLDPEKAPVFEDAYRRYVAGKSLRSLAVEWNQRGLLTTRGSLWTGGRLGRMLDTGFAAGLLREKSDVPGAERGTKPRGERLSSYDIWRQGSHEAAISVDLWEQYRRRRLAQAELPPRARTAVYELSSLLVCGAEGCGRKMRARWVQVRVKSRRYMQWYCWQANNAGSHPGNFVNDRQAMAAVMAWVEAQVEGGDGAAARAERFALMQQSAADVESVQRELGRLGAKRRRLVGLLADDRITVEEFDSLSRAVEAETLAARESLELARARQLSSGVDQLGSFVSLRESWEELPAADRREALLKVMGWAVVVPVDVSMGDRVRPVGRWEV